MGIISRDDFRHKNCRGMYSLIVRELLENKDASM